MESMASVFLLGFPLTLKMKSYSNTPQPNRAWNAARARADGPIHGSRALTGRVVPRPHSP